MQSLISSSPHPLALSDRRLGKSCIDSSPGRVPGIPSPKRHSHPPRVRDHQGVIEEWIGIGGFAGFGAGEGKGKRMSRMQIAGEERRRFRAAIQGSQIPCTKEEKQGEEA